MSFGDDGYIEEIWPVSSPEPSIDYSSLYSQGGPSMGVYGEPSSTPFFGGDAGESVSGSASSRAGSFNQAGGWLQQAYRSFLGPGSFLGGSQGAFPGQEKTGWLGPLMSIASGMYGMSQAERQKKMAQQAIQGTGSPWFTPGGARTPGAIAAGGQLTSAINGDFANDAGFNLAQQAAARASSQQPGGFAASAAAMAALKYQNDRIQALSGPAGVGIAPGGGYELALNGMSGANKLASSSLGSISYGLTGDKAGIPPWLTSYLIANGIKI